MPSHLRLGSAQCALRAAALAATVLALPACATIAHGKPQVLPVASTPAGARVSADSVSVTGHNPELLTIESVKEVGQIEVGSPYVGIELHKSFPLLN